MPKSSMYDIQIHALCSSSCGCSVARHHAALLKRTFQLPFCHVNMAMMHENHNLLHGRFKYSL